jgi:serine/threonine protein kinase
MNRKCIKNIEEIGSGAFGKVMKAVIDEGDKITGSKGSYAIPYLAAIKEFGNITERERDDIYLEAYIMAQCHHENVLRLVCGTHTRL